MRKYLILSLLACGFQSAKAQNFSQTYFFGDSNLDSGRYLYLPQRNNNPGQFAIPNMQATTVTTGVGAYTTNPDREWSQLLGLKFGKTINPVDAPGGGTNYGAGGATIDVHRGNGGIPGNGNIWKLSEQVGYGYNSTLYGHQPGYLESVGGRADPNALYVFWIGVNNLKNAASQDPVSTGVPNVVDDPSNGGKPNFPAIQTLANLASTDILSIRNAGGRYFVVGTTTFGGTPGNKTDQARTYYDNALFSQLSVSGLNFIPADFRTVDNFVVKNAATFGITNTTGYPCPPNVLSYQCVLPAGAGDKYFLADSDGHRSGTVQKIQADYVYSLITAPSLISFLPENAVKTGLSRASAVQEQATSSMSNAGQTGVNAWVTGDITSIQLDNYANFPNDPNIVTSVQAGVDYKFARGVLAGVALSAGRLKSDLGADGDFRQTETTVTIYGAYDAGLVWANVAGSLGSLDYRVNRTVPIGITYQQNTGKTSGDNWSVYGQAGLRFFSYGLTHGPVVGFVYQDIKVDGYTESGSALTNLQFNSQSRESTVGQFGYRVGFDYGRFHPFGQIMYNHEFASTNRQIGASVLSLSQYGIFSPTYTMPAVRLGEDWGTATAGIKYDAGAGFAILGSFSGDFSQDNATVYGGRIGVNVAF